MRHRLPRSGQEARAHPKGGVAEAKAYPGVGHVGILTALLPPLRHRAPVLADIVGFIGGQTAAVPRRVAA